MYSKIQLTTKSADYLAEKFFNKYKNSLNIISPKEANLMINDIYESMGIISKINDEEGDYMIECFSKDKGYIDIEDIRTWFKRYLCCWDTNIDGNNKFKENKKVFYRNYYNSKENNDKSSDLFFERELNNLNKEYNFNNLKNVYYEMIKKYNEKHIHNAIINSKNIFIEYDYNQNGYLEEDEIKQIIQDTLKLIQEDELLLNLSINDYKELLTYDKQYGKISLADYLLFVLRYLNK